MYSKPGLAIATSVFQKDVNINVASVDFLKIFYSHDKAILQIFPVFQRCIKWKIFLNDFIFWLPYLDIFGWDIFGF